MMIMMAVGFIVVRCKLLKAEDSKIMSVLLVYVFQACMLIQCFQLEVTQERMKGYIVAVIFGTFAMLLQVLIARLLRRPWKLTRIDEASLIYSNCGNLIIPLVQMTLGTEMVFYCSAIQIPFNFLIWSHGIAMVKGERKLDIKKILTTPCMIAIILGMIMMVTGIRLPSIVSTAVDGFSAMVAPGSMLAIGMVIGGSNLKDVFAFKKGYLIAFGRLILMPVVTMAILYATGIVQRNLWLQPIFLVSIMAVAAPQAGTIAQLANINDQEPLKASIYNVITTLLCFVTLPVIILLYQMVFPG